MRQLTAVLFMVTAFAATALAAHHPTFTPPTLIAHWGGFGTEAGKIGDGRDIAIRDGTVWVLEGGNARVQQFSEDGRSLQRWGRRGPGEGTFELPTGLVFDGQGNLLIVDRYSTYPGLLHFSQSGEYLGRLWSGRSGKVAIDRSGHILIPEEIEPYIDVLDAGGTLLERWGPLPVLFPWRSSLWDLAVFPDGHLGVTDLYLHQVIRLSSNGHVLGTWQAGSDFSGPVGLAADEDFVYVTDGAHHQILVFSTEGTSLGAFSTRVPGLPIDEVDPAAIAIDPSGVIYVLTGNYVLKYTWALSVKEMTWTAVKRLYRD